MKVELLLAYEDHTWQTETFDLPEEFDEYTEDKDIIDWWNWSPSREPAYRKVVLAAVYCFPAEEETE